MEPCDHLLDLARARRRFPLLEFVHACLQAVYASDYRGYPIINVQVGEVLHVQPAGQPLAEAFDHLPRPRSANDTERS